MSLIYTQTDTVAPLGVIQACAPVAPAGDADAVEAVDGGTAGTTALAVGIPANSTVTAFATELRIADSDSLDSGTLTHRLNVSTAQGDLTLEEIYVCRVASGGTSQETLGSVTGLGTDISVGGVFSTNVTLSAASAHNAGDRVYIVVVVANAHLHSSRTLEVLPNQNIDTPFVADVSASGGSTASVDVVAVGAGERNAVLGQGGFRFRADDGTETSATWLAAENTAATVSIPATFRLRIVTEETAGGTASYQPALEYRKDGGAWTTPGALSSGADIAYASSGTVTDETATTDQIGGDGSFVAGHVTSGDDVDTSVSLTADGHTEHEWTLTVNAVGDYEFRVTDQGTELDSYPESAPPSGGSTASVDVVPAGAGTKHASGGASASVGVSPVGSGLKRALLGAAAAVAVLAAGAGEKVASGGAASTVDVVAVGGGEVGASAGSGGADAFVDVTAVGAGQKAASSGAGASVDVIAVGAGAKAGDGGSAATVDVTTQGAGQKAADGDAGSTVDVVATGAGTRATTGSASASVDVVAAGAGAKATEGGAATTVDITATGAGARTASGGAGAIVEVVATGAGSVPGAGQGGSTATVEVVAAGAGTRQTSGGSGIVAEVVATATGEKGAEGAAAPTVDVASTGDGTKGGTGAAGATVDVLAAGAGTKATSGGATATVDVTAVGGGQEGAPTPIVIDEVYVVPARRRSVGAAADARTYQQKAHPRTYTQPSSTQGV